MTKPLVAPASYLTQRAISWDDANKLRDNFNSGLLEECETADYAMGGHVFIKNELMLLVIDVRDDSLWALPVTRESNVLTATAS